MVEHRYGGPWSEIKLDILRRYLGFFTSALRNEGFELRYIDGFAETGSRTVAGEGSVESIFGFDEALESQEVDGSAKIALATEPPFQRLDFIEHDPRRFSALEALCAEHPEATAHSGNANTVLTDLCRNTVWRGAEAPGKGVRAVLFLDPYGMTVDYTTLQTVCRTKAIDVWYLFPLAGLYRQAARNEAKIDDHKAAAITRILGSEEWRTRFYQWEPDLLDLDGRSHRIANVNAIEAYVRERLKAVFHEVTQPRRIYHSQGMPIFSLFFGMSNPDPAAVGLAMKAANHILKAGSSSQTRSR